MININQLTKIPFSTTQSDLLQFNGQDFTILRELAQEKEYDFQGIYMFEIQFDNGEIIQAFEDEIVESFFICNSCGVQFNDTQIDPDAGEHICIKCSNTK